MKVLVTYDVCTLDKAGKRRLNKIAKACQDYGQRVQNSVFECDVDSVQWQLLKDRLLNLFNEDSDSLRFYYLGSKWDGKIEHHGTKAVRDLDQPLIL